MLQGARVCGLLWVEKGAALHWSGFTKVLWGISTGDPTGCSEGGVSQAWITFHVVYLYMYGLFEPITVAALSPTIVANPARRTAWNRVTHFFKPSAFLPTPDWLWPVRKRRYFNDWFKLWMVTFTALDVFLGFMLNEYSRLFVLIQLIILVRLILLPHSFAFNWGWLLIGERSLLSELFHRHWVKVDYKLAWLIAIVGLVGGLR